MGSYSDLSVVVVIHQSVDDARLANGLVTEEDHLDLLELLYFVLSASFSLHLSAPFEFAN